MSICKAVSRISSSVPVLAAGGVCGVALWVPALLLLGLAYALGVSDPFTPVTLTAIASGAGSYFSSRALGYPTEVPLFISAAGFATGFLLPPALFLWGMPEGVWTRDVLLPVLLLLAVDAIVFAGACRGAMAARGRHHGLAKDPSCPKCGYSLYYATDHRCPECGREFVLDELDLRLAQWDGTVLRPKQGA